MNKVLFIGSHLSKEKGTKSASENVAELLKNNYEIELCSEKTNQFSRMVDILVTSLFSKYNIMHIDIYSGKALIYANIAFKIANLRKKKIIMNLHGGRLSELYISSPNKLDLLNNAYKIISPSKFLTQFFNSRGFKVETLPNYIDNKFFPYKRENIKKYSLLWVRAFNDIYQPELAIKTVSILKKKYPEIHLTMIGPDKGFQKSSEELISKLKLQNNISILGKIPNEELYKYFHTHQVYLNTTLYESFGLAVLEAASCGIPIVSTNVGELPYIWEDGEEILLCNSNENEFAEKVSEIFENQDLEKKLSINARKRSEEFGWENIKEKWVKVINETI
ncbi:MAG: hypothetical protein CL623_11825 [Arcobacter sp.]|nr:hypothetical protein [Arcobacter sp.]|tara:strand:- start:5862 stop:6866 length:1005 start_codon:yes stop_codon:yes gene_type:complete